MTLKKIKLFIPWCRRGSGDRDQREFKSLSWDISWVQVLGSVLCHTEMWPSCFNGICTHTDPGIQGSSSAPRAPFLQGEKVSFSSQRDIFHLHFQRWGDKFLSFQRRAKDRSWAIQYKLFICTIDSFVTGTSVYFYTLCIKQTSQRSAFLYTL